MCINRTNMWSFYNISESKNSATKLWNSKAPHSVMIPGKKSCFV